jgi:hypothetical protein
LLTVALSSGEGHSRYRTLDRCHTRDRRDFDRLYPVLAQQERPFSCGIATACTVVRAMPGRTRRITERSIFDNLRYPGALSYPAVERMDGTSLRHVAEILRAYGARTWVSHGDQLALAGFRRLLTDALRSSNKLVTINYDRRVLGQRGGGHHSLVGAYDRYRDRFLILDVNRREHPHVWVPAERLFRSTRGKNSITGEGRGILVVKVQ